MLSMLLQQVLHKVVDGNVLRSVNFGATGGGKAGKEGEMARQLPWMNAASQRDAADYRHQREQNGETFSMCEVANVQRRI